MLHRIARFPRAPREVHVLAIHEEILIEPADRLIDRRRNEKAASASPGRIEGKRIEYLRKLFGELRGLYKSPPLTAARKRDHLDQRIGVKHAVGVQRQVERRAFRKGLAHKQ